MTKEIEVLICAATSGELECWPGDWQKLILGDYEYIKMGQLGFLITGVGVPMTMASLLSRLSYSRPRLIVNIGIAGAYPNSLLKEGELVVGKQECFGDVGVELPSPPSFRPLSDFEFGKEYAEEYHLEVVSDVLKGNFSEGKGCTVNCCTGTEKTGLMREGLFKAQFETMEGAAVAHVGRTLELPVIEIRSISNIASTRNITPKKVSDSLESLKSFLKLNQSALEGL